MKSHPAPTLQCREDVLDYLLSFDIFKGKSEKWYAHVRESIGRLFITSQMIPPAAQAQATLLELGAHPYLLTLLLKKLHQYDLRLANDFGLGDTRSESTQDVSSARYNQAYSLVYDLFPIARGHFPYPDNSLDGVLCCELLQYMTVDPRQVLLEIHRVLKRGGFLLLTTPNVLRWNHLYDLALGRPMPMPRAVDGNGTQAHAYREYAPDEVIELLRECDFAVQKLRLANIQHNNLTQFVASGIRTHWSEHIFALAQAQFDHRPARWTQKLQTQPKRPSHQLTRDHVIWGYRLFLDREPENEEIIANALRDFPTTQDLRILFLSSPEFRLHNPENVAYSDQRNIVMKEIGGDLRLFVDLADQVIGLNIIRGVFEPHEVQFVLRTLQPGQNVLDLGANIGFFAIVMASMVGESGHVYAFEPFDQNTELLERSIGENRFEGRVTLVPAAVGQASGITKIILARRRVDSGGVHLFDGAMEVPDDHEVREIPIVALDDYTFRRPVHFIKIDIEGAEPLAFRAAQDILQNDRPTILSELHPEQLMKVSNYTPADYIADMNTYGYDCYILDAGHIGEKVTDVSADSIWSVVFVPKT